MGCTPQLAHQSILLVEKHQEERIFFQTRAVRGAVVKDVDRSAVVVQKGNRSVVVKRSCWPCLLGHLVDGKSKTLLLWRGLYYKTGHLGRSLGVIRDFITLCCIRHQAAMVWSIDSGGLFGNLYFWFFCLYKNLTMFWYSEYSIVKGSTGIGAVNLYLRKIPVWETLWKESVSFSYYNIRVLVNLFLNKSENFPGIIFYY